MSIRTYAKFLNKKSTPVQHIKQSATFATLGPANVTSVPQVMVPKVYYYRCQMKLVIHHLNHGQDLQKFQLYANCSYLRLHRVIQP